MILVVEFDPVEFFSSDEIFVGFTAGTGQFADNHDIMDFCLEQSTTDTCDQTMAPTPAPTTPAPTTPAPTTPAPTSLNDICFEPAFPPGAACSPDGTGFTLNSMDGNSDEDDTAFMIEDDTCFLRLLDEVAEGPSSGSAFRSFSFNQAINPDRVFSLSMGYRMFGSTTTLPADGLALVMHQDPEGVHLLGTGAGGSGLGYRNPTPKTALIIELDTCKSYTMFSCRTRNECQT